MDFLIFLRQNILRNFQEKSAQSLKQANSNIQQKGKQLGSLATVEAV
jgi:hypothetical protein